MFRFKKRSGVVLVTMMVVSVLVLPAVSLLAAPAAGTVRGDLGDAPDSTNSVGLAMPAYPWGVVANFPTVFSTAPQGPLHWAPAGNAWLGGPTPSMENDADVLPDVDGLTNIDPSVPADNRDGFDDGVMLVNPGPPAGVNLPQCASTSFRYMVTAVAAPSVPTMFANVWFDFNRDGDWDDVLTCTTASGGVATVREWAVRDQGVVLTPGASIVVMTPAFVSFHTLPSRDIWMRISVAEFRAPISTVTGLADGRGPSAGYRFGETEDYHLRFTGTGSIYG